MNKEQLKHMFDSSACLSTRQLKSYASGKMVHEEAHTVEVHLLSCPFCTDALEGLTNHKDSEAFEDIEQMNADFLHKHFKNIPQEKASVTKAIKKPKVKSTISFNPQLIKNLSIAAGIILLVGIFWFMRDSIFPTSNEPEHIAQNTGPVTEKSDLRPAFEEEQQSEAIDTPTDNALVSTQEVATVLSADNTTKEINEAAPKPAGSQPATAANANKNADVGPPTLKEVAPTVAKDVEEEMKKDRSIASTTSADQQNSYYEKRLGNSFDAGAESKPELQVESSAATGIERADELYNKGRYRRALKQYQGEMFNPKSPAKDQATYMAAQCHLHLGETTQAKTLLNSLVKEKSSLQGKAKQQLDKL